MYPFDKKEQIIYYLCARIVNVSLEMGKVTSFNIMNGNYKLTNNEIINKYELINVINHKNMLKEKCSPKFISKITNLSISEINKLKVN